jgi:hypothetical protein
MVLQKMSSQFRSIWRLLVAVRAIRVVAKRVAMRTTDVVSQPNKVCAFARVAHRADEELIESHDSCLTTDELLFLLRIRGSLIRSFRLSFYL